MSNYFANGKEDNGANEVERALNRRLFRSRYKTSDPDEYEEYLRTLNMVEIRSHCLEIQQKVPRGQRENVITQLVKEFKKFHVQAQLDTKSKTKEQATGGDIPREIKNMLGI